MNTAFIRMICALIVGLIFTIWPQFAAQYLVIALGILFLVPGLVGLINYFSRPHDGKNDLLLPIAAGGSALLGLLLLIMPDFFKEAILFLLGVLLFLAGGYQLYQLIIARKTVSIPVGYFVLPVLITLAGLFTLINPIGVQNTIIRIVGITFLVYAIADLIQWLKLK